MCVVKLMKVVVLICRCFFSICSMFLFLVVLGAFAVFVLPN